MMLTWRHVADWAKHRPLVLRLADQLGRGRGRLRLFDALAAPPPLPSGRRVDLTGWSERPASAVWIGHATVLIRIGGLTLLTDPVFSNRIGLGLGLATAGPRRHIAPAVSLRELPPIDLILVSHAHYDHLDRPTLARLNRRTPVITSEHNGDLIRDLGYRRVHELRLSRQADHLTGDSVRHGDLTVAARRVPHWAPRTFHDTHRGYCAFLLEAAGKRILFGGDSAAGSHFDDLCGIDLAILGIGGYDPFAAAHATPEEAWGMATRMRAKAILPIHHGTFRISREPLTEPARRLQAVAATQAARPGVPKIVGFEVGACWQP